MQAFHIYFLKNTPSDHLREKISITKVLGKKFENPKNSENMKTGVSFVISIGKGGQVECQWIGLKKKKTSARKHFLVTYSFKL